MEESQHKYDPMGGCFFHMFWILFGPGLLMVLGCVLLINRVRVGSPLDLVYISVVLVTILARLLDPTKEATGAAAQTGRMKYVVGVLAVAATLYVLAHLVVPRLFP